MSVEDSLRALGSEDEGQVPPHVDRAVMAAWDKWGRGSFVEDTAAVMIVNGRLSSTNDPRPHFLVWAAGVAAVVVCAVTVAWWTTHSPTSNATIIPATHVPVIPVSPGPPETARIPDIPRTDGAPPVARRDAIPVRTATPPTESTDAAIVLVPELESGSPLTLMRVRMARREFSRLGVPISNPDGDGLVDVEVIVGEDGVARSIRRAVAVGWTGPNP